MMNSISHLSATTLAATFVPLGVFVALPSLPWVVKAVLGHTALTGIVVTIASSRNFAARSMNLFGKNTKTGTIPVAQYLLLLPFHIGVFLAARVHRLFTSERPWTEISPGVYLGDWPQRTKDLPCSPICIVDTTNELPRLVSSSYEEDDYMCLPAWETLGLSVGQIQRGIEWIDDQTSRGRSVYIHCTHGHGRSAILAAAYLIASTKKAENPEEAFERLESIRKGARPNPYQATQLDDWWASRQQASGQQALSPGS
jgi:protein-tyrosine phosphatase